MIKLFPNFQSTLDLDIIKQGTNGLFWHLKGLSNLIQLRWKFCSWLMEKESVKIIASLLSKKFNAPEETILVDIIEMLQNLSDKGFIEENG